MGVPAWPSACSSGRGGLPALLPYVSKRAALPLPTHAFADAVHGLAAFGARLVPVQGKLGSGAFGTVYRATWGDRAVAVKLVPLMEDGGAGGVCREALESLKQEVQVGGGWGCSACTAQHAHAHRML